MENLALEIAKRNLQELKNNASNRLRKAGFIPGVLYGLKTEPLNIKVGSKSFKDLIKGRGISGHIFDLHLKEDGKAKKITAIIKDYQIEPLSREYSHLDFVRIRMEQEITIQVPILILNEEKSYGIKEQGGVLQHGIREIEITCLPKDIPEHIEIDIIDLKIGDIIKISDIKVADNIKILSDPDEMVLTIIYATQLREEEIAAPPAEEAEPEVIKKEKAEEKEEEK
ncbi:MAG: 50S ribosomal protein L25 [Actinobacteria bacterium]|nr:50S ribosomal protein L25 [Actinomycetota bacterium]MCL6087585.1 50S ribosomal protein L25 [Actinomycetota bacterium]